MLPNLSLTDEVRQMREAMDEKATYSIGEKCDILAEFAVYDGMELVSNRFQPRRCCFGIVHE